MPEQKAPRLPELKRAPAMAPGAVSKTRRGSRLHPRPHDRPHQEGKSEESISLSVPASVRQEGSSAANKVKNTMPPEHREVRYELARSRARSCRWDPRDHWRRRRPTLDHPQPAPSVLLGTGTEVGPRRETRPRTARPAAREEHAVAIVGRRAPQAATGDLLSSQRVSSQGGSGLPWTGRDTDGPS